MPAARKRKTICGLIMVLAFTTAAGLAAAQVNTEPPRLPEVNPGLDNPNNPALPNSGDTNPSDRRDDKIQHGNEGAPQPLSPRSRDDATTGEHARCGALNETMARRRCLEDLQQRQ